MESIWYVFIGALVLLVVILFLQKINQSEPKLVFAEKSIIRTATIGALAVMQHEGPLYIRKNNNQSWVRLNEEYHAPVIIGKDNHIIGDGVTERLDPKEVVDVIHERIVPIAD